MTIGTYSASGWTFYLPLSTNVYKGIDFTLTQIPATGGKITIKYTDGNNQEISLSSNSVNVDFNHSGYISTIEFAGDGWHASAEEYLGDLTYGIGDCYVVARPITATVTDAKYATFAVGAAIDYSTTAPSGLKAYIAYVEDNKVKLTEVTEVPANTAVILYADVNTNTEYTLMPTTEATVDVTANDLRVSDGTVKGGNGIYALAKKSNVVGFYLVDSSVTIPAGKVYLKTSTSGSSVKEFFSLDLGGETAISEIANGQSSNCQWYNLAGQRVQTPTRGIYIQNGKKVIIK